VYSCDFHPRLKAASIAIAAVLVGFGGLQVVHAFQGMGSAKRPPRPVPPVLTDLPPITVDFRDLAAEAGLSSATVSGADDRKRYILEATGNGVALFDADNDGRLDVFLPSATTLDGEGAGRGSTNRLYRNLGALRFEDVTDRAGLRRSGWGQGACAGDYDNDGRRDLFVTYYGQSVLYRNHADGTFRDETAAAGLGSPAARWDTGCSFVDYDLDGDLDLAVTSYLEFDRARVPEPGSGSYCLWKGLSVMCGPRGLPFARNHLFRNEGKGRFADVSVASGIARPSRCYGFTVLASDLDGDGHPDLYVACDSTPSLLYHNQRDGTFAETGLLSGLALNEDGQEQGGMGVAVADYDEDGHFDVAKTNFSDDVPNLYHNNGDGSFEDHVYRAGLGGTMEYVGWGIHFLDVDHDGRRELMMVNGHVYPEVEPGTEMRYRQPRLLYWNVGGGRFKDISGRSGAGVAAAWSSRGSAVGDLDDDGSLEVVVSNLGARPSLLKNLGPRQNWLLVRAEGSRANRDALGARVYLYVGGRRLSAEIQGGSSFLSQSDPRAHFGLGADVAYQRLEVQWPGGGREDFPGGPANRLVTVRESGGTIAFVGARLIDGTGRPAVEDAVLVVREGRVLSAGPRGRVDVPAGAQRIDLAGKTILPGLINAHGHAGDTVGLRSAPELYTAENVRRQLGLYARYGVTTVASLGGDQAAGFALRDAQEGPGLDRARLRVAGPVITAASPEEARALVDELAPRRPDLVKIRVDDNLGTAAKMAPAVYQAVIEQAHKHGLRVAAHVYYLDDAKGVLRAGADFIAHSVRDREVDDELIRLLKERRACLCPTLMREVSTFVYESEPDFFADPFFLREADPLVLAQLRDPQRQQQVRGSASAQAYKKALETASRNLARLAAAGVPIAMGTDTGPPGRFQGYFEHRELELMVKAGLTPAQVILSATRDAAACLGLAGKVGTLEPGAWADLIVLAKDPLADIRHTRTIESVWIAGKRVEGR
jgi:enediyne biosynthesis protein E4